MRTSDNIITPHLPVDEFKTHLRMNHGKLTLDPLNFRIDIGQIASVIWMGARKDLITTKADIKIRKVRLKRLLAETKDKSTRVCCIIGNFKVNEGLMMTAPFVIDTVDTNINITGQVDLGKESIDLRLNAKPKDISLLSARAPLNIKSPSVTPDASALAAKGAASAVLGVLLTPVASIIPWIDWGLGEDSACHALIDKAKADDAAAAKFTKKRSGRKVQGRRKGKSAGQYDR